MPWRDVGRRADDPEPLADALEQAPVVRDDDDGRRGLAEERLERLAGRDVEVVRRLVEEQQVRLADADERELQPRALAARQVRDRLADVVAAEQEPREVRPCRALVEARRREHRVKHGRPGQRPVPQLRQVGRHRAPADAHEPRDARAAGPRSCAGASSSPRRWDRRGRCARRGEPRAARCGRSARESLPAGEHGSRRRPPRAPAKRPSPAGPLDRHVRPGSRARARLAARPPRHHAAVRVAARARASSRACAGCGTAGRGVPRGRSPQRPWRLRVAGGRRPPRAGGGTRSTPRDR